MRLYELLNVDQVGRPTNPCHPWCMKKLFLLLPLAVLLGMPLAASAFWPWGLSDREQEICERRARREATDFSAKKAYERCAKSIREELGAADEREAQIERQKAAKEEARRAARQKLAPGIKQRCLGLLPQWRKLTNEREARRYEYNLARRALISQLTDMYGPNYAQFFRSKGFSVFSEYPDEILREFPLIRLYGSSLKQERTILKEIGGMGTTDEEVSRPLFFYALLISECNDQDVNSLADHLVDIRN